MKRWIGLALLVFVGTAGWRIGDALSPDALSMAVGVLFGVMAGVPTALLVMAGGRRRSSDERMEESHSRRQQALPMPVHGQMNLGQMHAWGMPYAQQPPVIIVGGPQGFGNVHPSAQPNAAWLRQELPARHFTVVGEREELVEDW
jgi:hypothetical protein